MRQVTQERVPHGRLLITPLQRGPRAAPLWKAAKGCSRLHAEQELDLPELVGLKTARRFEPLAEGEEFERRHRLEDVQLRDHDLEDGQDPLQRVLRAMRFLVVKELANAVEFVQQLLEPELVHLMDDDEQQLVVLRPLRARLLQRQQLVDLQVAGIRDGWIGHDLSSDRRPGVILRVNAWLAQSERGSRVFEFSWLHFSSSS